MYRRSGWRRLFQSDRRTRRLTGAPGVAQDECLGLRARPAEVLADGRQHHLLLLVEPLRQRYDLEPKWRT